MSDIQDRLNNARAEVHRLEREIAALACHESDHDWQLEGGRNACCGDPDCGCSVPVYVCRKCKDCDYGDNDEARTIVSQCAEGRT